jgi:hypothetical protein
MQHLFKNVKWGDNEKTLAKAIDEYNFVTVTLPIQNMEKAQNKHKKEINNLR